MKRIALTIWSVLLLNTVGAQVPGTLSYQGILVDGSGAPVADVSHTVVFRFYAQPTGGSPVFSRPATGSFNVTTYKGMFTFIIGTGSPTGNDPLPVLASDPNYIGGAQFYVGVVANGTELSPRVQLSSVPYAFTAQNANSVSATNISGTLPDARFESTVDLNSLNVGTLAQFGVNISGNIIKLNNLNTSFPSVQGATGSYLTNDGSGNLTWTTGGGGGSGWGLTGNSGTSGINFIGTTDNQPLNFRVNNITAGRVDETLANTFFGFKAGEFSTNSGNTSVGYQALRFTTSGGSNVAMGSGALYSNIGGSNAVAIGTNALQYSNSQSGAFDPQSVAVGFEALRGSTSAANNTGTGNTAIGYQSLTANTTGASNVGFGLHSLNSNTSGSMNIGMGHASLSNNITGTSNVSVGYHALFSNIAGDGATAIGYNAMRNSNNVSSSFTNSNVAVGYESLRGSATAAANTGNWNTSIGYQALLNNTSGTDNTSLGSRSLNSNTTGGANVASGSHSLQFNTTGSNNVAIGYLSGTTSNLANANTTGSNNTFVGSYSGPETATQLTNATAIGFNSKVGASNTLVLGAPVGTADAINISIGASTPPALFSGGAKLYVKNTNPILTYLEGSHEIGTWLSLKNTSTGGIEHNIISTGVNNSEGAGRLLFSDGTSIMTWHNGNLGLGIPTPGAKLDVAGAVKIVDGTQGAGKVLTSNAFGLASWQPAGAGSGWGLTGNAGTVDGTSFIGTTDNVPLNIRVNNFKSGRIDHLLGNAFYGYQSGYSITTGSSNVAVGNTALNKNTTGSNNSAIGTVSLYNNTSGLNNNAFGTGALFTNTTGFDNNAIGYWSLNSNSTGNYNDAIGAFALEKNTVGDNNVSLGGLSLNTNVAGSNGVAIGRGAMQFANSQSTAFTNSNVAVGYQALRGSITASDNTGGDNTAVGYQALIFNSQGYNNSANGSHSLYSNSTGFNNTANGQFALYSNTTGTDNTATGAIALQANSLGSYNTAFGRSALSANTTGTSNTAIGYSANVSTGALTNATAIGNGALVNASNKIRLGNSSVTVIEGQVAYTNSSDRRLKTNIEDLDEGLGFVLKLKPVRYKLKNHDAPKTNWGFIAQDIESLVGTQNAILTIGGDNDRTLGLRYTDFVAPLVKAVQEQQKLVDAQDEKIRQLETKLELLNKTLTTELEAIKRQLNPESKPAGASGNGGHKE